MAELRRDPIIGQWVIVHTDDSLAPHQYDREDHAPYRWETCQFCPGREHLTPPEVSAVRGHGSSPNSRGWQVRVVSNKFPALKIEGNIDETKEGMFHFANGVGAHEVLIETPVHDRHLADFTEQETADVVQQYQSRLTDLTGDRRFKYIIIFKNFGASAGTSVEHPHSQIIALPRIPKYVLQKLEGAKAYQKRNHRCVFCDIIEQEHQDQARIIAQNNDFIAFCPFVPRYTFEYWILPKNHSSDFSRMEKPERHAFARILNETLSRLKACLHNPSYNYYLHVAPVNTGQKEDFHWHLEVVPSVTRRTGFELGTGFYVVRTSPEMAAEHLRRAVVASAI